MPPGVLAVHFTDNVTLGALLIALVGGLVGLYRVALGARLKSTNEVLTKDVAAKDSEITRLDREAAQKEDRLRDLGAEKDTALAKAAACEATVAALTVQLERMPKYDDVIRLFGEQMNHADTIASERTQHAVVELAGLMERNDTKSQQRHDATLRVLQAIESKLTTKGTP